MTKQQASNPRERIDQLKDVFRVKKDADLARYLGVSSAQVYQWTKRGMSTAYGNLFGALLDEIGCCELSRRKGLSYCGTCGKPLKEQEVKNG